MLGAWESLPGPVGPVVRAPGARDVRRVGADGVGPPVAVRPGGGIEVRCEAVVDDVLAALRMPEVAEGALWVAETEVLVLAPVGLDTPLPTCDVPVGDYALRYNAVGTRRGR